MQIAFFATLRPIVGQKRVELPTEPGTTVQALAEQLVHRWPELREHLLDTDGQLGRRVNVFIDGRNVRWLPDQGKTVLTGAQSVELFPPVAGG